MNPDVVRAVLDAARAYRNEPGMHEGTPGLAKLYRAVDAFEKEITASEPNKPYGFVIPRPWNLVPAGWFVRVPNGTWFEVMATKQNGTMQDVTLRSPEGKTGTFPRKADAEVQVRRGTHTKELSDAIEALSGVFGPVEVISDESPPWDE